MTIIIENEVHILIDLINLINKKKTVFLSTNSHEINFFFYTFLWNILYTLLESKLSFKYNNFRIIRALDMKRIENKQKI